MSLILEALKRSEAEREKEQPNPATSSIEIRHRSIRRPALAVAVALVGAALAASAWWLYKPSPEEAVNLSPPAAQPQASSTVGPKNGPDPSAAGAAPIKEEHQPVSSEDRGESRSEPADRISARVPEQETPSEEPRRVVSEPPAEPISVDTAPTRDSEPPQPELAQSPPPAAGTRYPPVETMPRGSIREQIRAMKLNMHVYAEDPADRFVLIDLQRRTEGSDLGAGIRLAEIAPDGIIVDVEGKRYFWSSR